MTRGMLFALVALAVVQIGWTAEMPNGASHGLWGGTSPRERRTLRKNRAEVAKAEADPYRKSIG